MNIIVISNIELDESNAAGNTFANWLSNWPDASIASIYCRSKKPSKSFCDIYYSVSPISIVKNILTPAKIGDSFTKGYQMISKKKDTEEKLIKKTKLKNTKIFHLINDYVVSSKLWQNKQYRDFIEEYKPDIVFYFIKSESFIYENVKYIKSVTNAKTVGFIADDVYALYTKDNSLLNRRYKNRFHKLLGITDKIYGASILLCEEYGSRFQINIEPMYKGCDLSCMPKSGVNTPIKIVYAGNLYYGREQTLGYVAAALKSLNASSTKAFLEIYTGTIITEEVNRLLNIPGSSSLMGSRSYSEIKTILNQADIVLHVESFEKKNIDYVHLSYSTKISDCLQSGSMMMIVGPHGIASVEEARAIEGSVIIDSVDSILPTIERLLADADTICDNAKKTHIDAISKFPIENIRHKLQEDFCNLVDK